MFDALTDIAGLKVGHDTDLEGGTGCTVVLCEAGAVAGVDVRGAAPGTRETDLLRPGNLVQQVHAIVLSGGSAFGLDSAGGVMRYLEERGVGFQTGVACVPIVPAAILFDLGLGSATARPDAAAGYRACQVAASGLIDQGTVGAGTGATVGKVLGRSWATKGGVGTAGISWGDGFIVAALIAVNASGEVVDPETGAIVAGARGEDGRFVPSIQALMARRVERLPVGENTTIGVVATNVALDKAEANRLATVAHDGLARSIRPCHTRADGDTLFALSTGAVEGRPEDRLPLEALAADVVARAVVRAVRAATGLHGIPAVRDLAAGATRG